MVGDFRSKPKEKWGRLFPYFRVRKIYWRKAGDERVLLNHKIYGTHSWSEGDHAGLAVFDAINLAKEFRRYLLGAGGDEKQGAPPRGAAERKAQAVLKDLMTKG